ncbi:collagenase [Kistimonas asteriae]|uniref:collagenase n=1 Tax=Kistimonas asteriae TaxID=517724 RepID=UPI001BACA166|nr:collagenase [Kistimonas asteriae]
MKSPVLSLAPLVAAINLLSLSPGSEASSVDIETSLIHGRQAEEVLDGSPLPPSNPHRKLKNRELEEQLENQKASTLSVLSGATGSTCSTSEIARLDGQRLTETIRKADLQCINGLFSATGSTSRDLFHQNKMITVANAVYSYAQNYPGNNSQGMEQLFLYLRAGYYVQFYQKDTVGAYDIQLDTIIQYALDAFFANPKTFTVSDENGSVLGEAVTLIDSSVQNARYISIVKRLLTSYDQRFEASRNMTAAVNNGMTVLFRGHQVKAFVEAVEQDNSLLDELYNFYNTKQHLLDTDNEYLLTNVVRELGRFLQHKSLQPKVSGQLKAIVSQQKGSEKGQPLWLVAAEMTSYYDNNNCDYYGVCNFKQDVERTVLPFRHTCSQTLKIRAQNMSVPQAQWACDQLSEQEAFFHRKLVTNHQPVANDQNQDLELVIFDSTQDYKMYAGLLFNISTDNGGMYLEGDPTKAGNQARFVAYEADWQRPEFHIWNLRHEYVHYLDGRFNMAGGFGRSTSADTIWWIEGLGEYISHRDEYPEAINYARQKSYPLSTIFRNTYSSGQTRVYRWGYLAVRFMFERHPSDVTEMLSLVRNDRYDDYKSWLNQIGSQYDNEWYDWLASVNSIKSNLPDHGPADDDAVIDKGDETIPEIPEPDDTTPPDTARPGVDKDVKNPVLQNGVTKVGLHSDKNKYFYILVPHGAKNLTFTVDGRTGSGELEVFVQSVKWPTESVYEYREQCGRDKKTITVSPLKTNAYYHVMIKTKTPFSGIQLTATYK